jgi:hypothetical protein
LSGDATLSSSKISTASIPTLGCLQLAAFAVMTPASSRRNRSSATW